MRSSPVKHQPHRAAAVQLVIVTPSARRRLLVPRLGTSACEAGHTTASRRDTRPAAPIPLPVLTCCQLAAASSRRAAAAARRVAPSGQRPTAGRAPRARRHSWLLRLWRGVRRQHARGGGGVAAVETLRLPQHRGWRCAPSAFAPRRRLARARERTRHKLCTLLTLANRRSRRHERWRPQWAGWRR